MTSTTTKFPIFNWMRGVRADQRITILHRFVLLALMIERDSRGRCAPGYDALVRKTGVHRASIIRAIEVGVRYGWLAPPIRHRRDNAEFVFTFPADQEVAENVHQNDDQEVRSLRHQENQEVAADEVRSRSQRFKKSQRQRGSPAKTNSCASDGHKKEGHKRGQSQTQAAPGVAGDGEADAGEGDDFEKFWAVYPKHEGEKDARRAFAAARRAGVSADVMIEGAAVYAVKTVKRAADHKLNAARWITGERWRDPLPGAAILDEAGDIVGFAEPEDEAGEAPDLGRPWSW